jgi:hypothetical protein
MRMSAFFYWATCGVISVSVVYYYQQQYIQSQLLEDFSDLLKKLKHDLKHIEEQLSESSSIDFLNVIN